MLHSTGNAVYVLYTNICSSVRYPAGTECLRVLHANKVDCILATAVMQGSTVRCAVANVGHAGGINCLDLSPDGRFLVAVGLNSHSKQLMILWNVTGLVDGHKVTQHTASLLDSSLTFLSDYLLYYIQDCTVAVTDMVVTDMAKRCSKAFCTCHHVDFLAAILVASAQ